MRFMEIANPEDQLALWKMVSDKMWAAFAQQVPQAFNGSSVPTAAPQSSAGVATRPQVGSAAKPTRKSSAKTVGKTKTRAAKPKRAPMAPPPKPLPKPKAQQLTPTQATKQQTQQHQQLAQHLSKELAKPQRNQKIYPQPPTPTQKPPTPVAPMNNSYDERDKDELVLHSRAQNPFKTVGQTKMPLTGQKRGF